MKLFDQIMEDYNVARKGNDNTLKMLLSVLIGEIQLKQSKQEDEMSEKDIIKIAKKLKGSCETMATHGCNTAKTESALLDRYIPTPVGIEELRCMIISSHLYQDILDADNPMKLMNRAQGMLSVDGVSFDSKDLATVMREFKEQK